ncbi:hypothetical protein CRENBAI_008280 [Crenichthys baileyi]|uniref:Uncharacterized protein n=1 Tax=Crenichthys baileyi TaxID=28760 RepID=A0AAV9SQS5_9TELE
MQRRTPEAREISVKGCPPEPSAAPVSLNQLNTLPGTIGYQTGAHYFSTWLKHPHRQHPTKADSPLPDPPWQHPCQCRGGTRTPGTGSHSTRSYCRPQATQGTRPRSTHTSQEQKQAR